MRLASSTASWAVRSTHSNGFFECGSLCARWRALTRSATSAVPALTPTTAARAGRTQLRGSRMAESSQASSSSWASSVRLTNVSSSRSRRCAGGSIGVRALRSRASKSAAPELMGALLFDAGSSAPSYRVGDGLRHHPLELPDRTVQQHLGGAVGPAERAGDLPVVHAQGEAHDQRLSPVVGQLL